MILGAASFVVSLVGKPRASGADPILAFIIVPALM